MKGMVQEGHRVRAGRGQASPRQNSRTASGTRSHKMQNKKGGGIDRNHWAGAD